MIRGRVHTSKPSTGGEIDWLHPLSRGLRYAWLFNQARGLESDIAQNTSTVSSLPIPKIIHDGRMVGDCSGADNYIEIGDPTDLHGTTALTIIVSTSALSYVGGKTVISIRNGTGTGGLIQFYTHDAKLGDGTRIYFAGIDLLSGVGQSLADGKLHQYAYVMRSQTDHELYTENISVDTSSTSRTFVSTLTNITIGMWYPTNQPFHGQIEYVYIFKKALTVLELDSLYRNPYQILKSRKNILHVPVVEAGGATGKSNPMWGPLGGPLAGVLS